MAIIHLMSTFDPERMRRMGNGLRIIYAYISWGIKGDFLRI